MAPSARIEASLSVRRLTPGRLFDPPSVESAHGSSDSKQRSGTTRRVPALPYLLRQAHRAAGLQVFPIAVGLARTKRAICFYSVLLLAVSLAPVALGIGGWAYATVAGVSGLGFLAWGAHGLRAKDTISWARSLFLASLPHLVLLFVALVASSQ